MARHWDFMSLTAKCRTTDRLSWFILQITVAVFLLELTWLRDHTEAYELGENESHLCIRVEGDYDEVRRFHKEMGCVCFENEQMGLYFINDPDDYWIEILPVKY